MPNELGKTFFTKLKMEIELEEQMLPHRNIHNYIWISSDGKTHSSLTIF
jgi:hypothetical protein